MQTQLGEGIRWDGRRGELLEVDILAGRVARGPLRADGLIERVGVYQLPGTVGMIAPIQGDDGWVLGAGRGFVHLALDGTQRTIAQVAPAGTRMNDGAVCRVRRADLRGRGRGMGARTPRRHVADPVRQSAIAACLADPTQG